MRVSENGALSLGVRFLIANSEPAIPQTSNSRRLRGSSSEYVADGCRRDETCPPSLAALPDRAGGCDHEAYANGYLRLAGDSATG